MSLASRLLRPPRGLSGVSDVARDAFDYIVNTRPAYDKMRAAVLELERRSGPGKHMKERLDVDQQYIRSDSAKWRHDVGEAMRIAINDYRKGFPEEYPDAEWPKAWRKGTLTVFDLMKVALASPGYVGLEGITARRLRGGGAAFTRTVSAREMSQLRKAMKRAGLGDEPVGEMYWVWSSPAGAPLPYRKFSEAHAAAQRLHARLEHKGKVLADFSYTGR